MAPAILFLANAYGVDLSVMDQVNIILLLVLLTKGVAAVPLGAMVILTSVSVIIGLPIEGIALLMAVDFIMDMARTATNLVGNALAAVAMANSEGLFREENGEELVKPKLGHDLSHTMRNRNNPKYQVFVLHDTPKLREDMAKLSNKKYEESLYL